MIVKYAKDVRYSEENITTHCGMSLEAMNTIVLGDLEDKSNYYDVVGIDEGQFFPDTVPWAEEMANRGKIVVVAALDGTFQRKPFGNILSLIPLAENVTKLNAVCMKCFGDAAFSKRIKPEDGEMLEVIGGTEKYMAVCRICYLGNVTVLASPLYPLKRKMGNNCDEDDN